MLLDVYGNVNDYTTDESLYGNVFRFSVIVPSVLIRRGPSSVGTIISRGPSDAGAPSRRGPSLTPDTIRR